MQIGKGEKEVNAQEIKERWERYPELHADGFSVIDKRGNVICSCSHWGNQFPTVLLKEYAKSFAAAPGDIAWLLEENERLSDLAEKRKCCGNCSCYRHKVSVEPLKITESFVNGKKIYHIDSSQSISPPEKICLGVDGAAVCDDWDGVA